MADFFQAAGRIKSGKIVTDKLTGKSKGIAYVEFYSVPATLAALRLDGSLIWGQAVSIHASETNRASSIEQATLCTRRVLPPGGNKLTLRGIHPAISEQQLRRLCESLGRLEAFAYAPAERDDGRGVAIVAWAEWEDVKRALSLLQAFPLAGCPLAVRFYGGEQDEAAFRQCREVRDVAAAGSSASACILISNAFDAALEPEAGGWQDEVAEEVRSECSKYGRLLHVAVQARSPGGDVYVRFADAVGAQAAIEALHGRWFGLRQLACRCCPENLWADLFAGS